MTAENRQATHRVSAVAQSGCLWTVPCNVRIPKKLARQRLFRALPAEYPANTEVEAHERASGDNLYAEQQVSAHCAKEQLIAEGTHACYADVQSPDSLWKNSHNAEDTIPERVTRLQSLHTRLSFVY